MNVELRNQKSNQLINYHVVTTLVRWLGKVARLVAHIIGIITMIVVQSIIEQGFRIHISKRGCRLQWGYNSPPFVRIYIS
jgi:hypothetical protein